MKKFILFIISIIILNVNAERWVPKVGTTWNWILNADSDEIDSDEEVEVLGIDLFDHSKEKIEELKEKYKIICYFSAGTLEFRRPDTEDFQKIPGLVRDKMDDWDEYYLNINDRRMLPLMAKRLDLAQSKGCDGVEPDNIDIYLAKQVQKWDKPVTRNNQITYDIWLSQEARMRGLSIGLKNDIANAKALVDYFDFAINEECYDFDECGLYENSFISEDKAVFMAAYGSTCDKKFLKKLEVNTSGKNLSIIIKDELLRPKYKSFNPDNYTFDTICGGFAEYQINKSLILINMIVILLIYAIFN